jgi:hypothetical protein
MLCWSIISQLCFVTDFLSPAYLVLSLVAVSSRHVSSLKTLASHGKTLSSSTMLSIQAKSNSSSLFTGRWWISKRRFVQFYIVGLIAMGMLTAVNVTNSHQYLARSTVNRKHTWNKVSGILGAAVLARVLLMLHLCRRVYECKYIQQYNNTSSKMHLAGYFLGMGHYLVLPLVFWNATQYTNHGMDRNLILDHLDHTERETATSTSLASFPAAVILLLLVASNLYFQYEQHQHHIILASLRSDKGKGDHDTSTTSPAHHSLPPKRRWFRWILCPHYLTEIFFYFSLALLLEVDDEMMSIRTIYDEGAFAYISPTCLHPGLMALRRYRHWMLVLWVTTNLTISALNSYDWYQKRYYCSGLGLNSSITHSTMDRKAIVPFLL